MKVIWNIYKRDIHKICKNPIAIFVVIGLIVLPSLYAWFNIKASWDPYGNTNGILVAVASDDQGMELGGEILNIGDKIVGNLEGNDKMGWQFVTSKEAIEGTKNGKYYAAVVIPEDFSEKLGSILTSNIDTPQIEYYVNEKKNAISPKITDKGVSSIQLQINETFVQLIAETAFEALNLTDEKLSKDGMDPIERMIKVFKEADRNLEDFSVALGAFENLSLAIGDISDTLHTMMPDTQRLVDDGADSLNQVQNVIDTSRNVSERINLSLDDIIDTNAELTDYLNDSLESLYYDLDNSADNVDSSVRHTKNICYNIISINSRIANTFQNINKLLPIPLKGIDASVAKLKSANMAQQDIIKALDDVRNLVSDGVGSADNLRKKTDNSVNETREQLDKVRDIFDYEIKPSINESVDGIYSGLSDFKALIGDVDDTMPKIEKSFEGIDGALKHTILALKNTGTLVDNAQGKIGKIVDELNSVSEDERWGKMINILRNNPSAAGEFMSSPVEINYNYLYPIKNYGSAMTPFYTILCLWVGGLILVSIIKTRVKEDENIKNVTPAQAYFGRYMLFLTIGMLQSLVVCLGNLYLLKVQCLSPMLFILAGMFCSLVFTLIIYTLTLSFGDVGKSIAIVLLVIQVAGSGGTFPIEVTPAFFRAINPTLPFTHGINAMRECVAGIYMPDYIKDIFKLAVFIPMSLVLGLFLRKPLIRLTEFFEKKLKETDVL
ncbi:MAG: YhgE/Pip domain-containing protein [Proteocatella sp.]